MRSEVRRILDAVSQTWSFDERDLTRPSMEHVLRAQISNADAGLQPRLESEFFHHGPLDALLEDTQTREIVVNGGQEIWIERAGAWLRHPDEFLSETTFHNFVERLCGQAQIKVDLAQPFADGRWREFRVHLGCAPLTQSSFHITLRRLSNSQWTLSKLRELEWATDSQLQVLKDLIEHRKNLLFIGPTGCGKTTALSACLGALAESERVVVIEDTDELPRPNSASTKLLTRPEANSLPEVDLTTLVRQSLRMRPSRLVMGEVRSGEAKDLLLALATGHSGSFGTLHASDPRQALLRLEMLVQLGAPQWNLQAIRQLIQLSVDALVVCGFDNQKRRLEGIFKVAALESFGFLLEPMA